MCHDPQVAPLLTLKENDSLALSSKPMNIPELDSTESVTPVESLAFFLGERGVGGGGDIIWVGVIIFCDTKFTFFGHGMQTLLIWKIHLRRDIS